MLSEEVKRYKQNSAPYQITKLKLLMEKAFGRSLRKSKIDLTPVQLQLLGLLVEKGSCAMQELADELVVDNSAITRTIDTLEKKQFVKRTVSKEDRRVKLVTITPIGEAEGVKTIKLTEFHKRKLVEGIEAEQLENFMQSLSKMRRNVEDFILTEEKITKE